MLEKALARLDLWTHNYSKLIRNSLKNVCSTHLAFKLSAPGLLRATKASSIKSFVGKRRFSISRSLSQAGAHGILSFTISFHTIARLHEIEETLDYATEICLTWLEGKQWFRGLRLASFLWLELMMVQRPPGADMWLMSRYAKTEKLCHFCQLMSSPTFTATEECLDRPIVSSRFMLRDRRFSVIVHIFTPVHHSS